MIPAGGKLAEHAANLRTEDDARAFELERLRAELTRWSPQTECGAAIRAMLVENIGAAVARAEPKIITVHVYPPIPLRRFDWRAYYDGTEETGRYGEGATEAEAIADLRENEGFDQ